MRVPVIRGVIERRILINFRVEPTALGGVLPQPLRPKLVGGQGVAGICLIRLRDIRPRWLPRGLGISSENAAHRIAVAWGGDHEGVFVPRRDTSSRINNLVGGRLFPGVHHLSRFVVREDHPRYSIGISGATGAPILDVQARVASAIPAGSVFATLAEASSFFRAGSLGLSPSRHPGVLDSLELRAPSWTLEPLSVEGVSSSFFEDRSTFPSASVELDSAFLMRHVDHEWHGHPPLRCEQPRRHTPAPAADQRG